MPPSRENLFPPKTLSPRLVVLGVGIDRFGLSSFLSFCREAVRNKTPRHVITANGLMLLAAQDRPSLKSAFDNAHAVVPDSSGLLWVARWRHGEKLEKLPGIELIEHLCAVGAKESWRVYFLGAAPGVAERAAHVCVKKYPGLVLAGSRHGYFAPSENAAVVEGIRAANADLLFVAMGASQQEEWIHQNLSALRVPIVMGVGGSFDVLSGRLRRAPRWMQNVGLEWFFRLMQEPTRAGRMAGLPVFIIRAMTERLSSEA